MKCNHCQAKTTNDKFCSLICQNAAQSDKRKQDFLDGAYLGKHLQFRGWARTMLEELLGKQCAECEVTDTYNGKPITLQANHKDGDATNNVISNLELLCPNCHTQTENYGRKNKVSSRDWRRKAMLASQPNLGD